MTLSGHTTINGQTSDKVAMATASKNKHDLKVLIFLTRHRLIL